MKKAVFTSYALRALGLTVCAALILSCSGVPTSSAETPPAPPWAYRYMLADGRLEEAEAYRELNIDGTYYEFDFPETLNVTFAPDSCLFVLIRPGSEKDRYSAADYGGDHVEAIRALRVCFAYSPQNGFRSYVSESLRDGAFVPDETVYDLVCVKPA
nr:hypothetical protein [Clostridia bacterium]